MSGPRYKFQGTGFYVLREFGADSPSGVITGITNANPAVVSDAAHGLSSGDVIYIEDVEGMTEINNSAYIISRIDANSFSLVGINSTNWGTYTSNGSYDLGIWSELCSTAWSRTGAAKTEIEVTDSCSTEQEYLVGLPGPGTAQLSFNWAPLTSTAQVALRTWDESSDMMAVKLILPGNGGTIVHRAFVQQLTENAAVNGVWLASANLRLTGRGLYLEAA